MFLPKENADTLIKQDRTLQPKESTTSRLSDIALIDPYQIYKRKTVRTTMMAKPGDKNSPIRSAKIVMATGEVIPTDYAEITPIPPRPIEVHKKANINPLLIGPLNRNEGKCNEQDAIPKKRKARKILENSLYPLLQQYDTISVAKASIWYLDDVLFGITHINGTTGNTRPLSQHTLFWLLRSLPIITTDAVMQATRCGIRHSERIAEILRAIIRASERMRGKSSYQMDHMPPIKPGDGYLWHGDAIATSTAMGPSKPALHNSDEFPAIPAYQPFDLSDDFLTSPI